MADLIPINWRESMEGLRNDLHRIIDRWILRRSDAEEIEEGEVRQLPVQTDKEVSPFRMGSPAIDMAETPDEVTITGELPGLDRDDFSLEMSGNRLIIRGEKRQSKKQEGKGYRYEASMYGSFTRAIPMPCEVDADRIEAKYKDGVLKVTIPKTESAKGRRIPVHAG
jgi:HSP20 family protein